MGRYRGMGVLRMSGNGTKTLQDLTEADLRQLYLIDLLTLTQIAKLYSTTQASISRRRRKWGIETLGKTGRKALQLPALTPKQCELLVGSLLGDGSMSAPSHRTARFTEGHSMKQAAYTEWKAELLQPFTSTVADATKVKDGKVYQTRYFTTQTCTALRPYYDLFYTGEGRVFPASLPDLITPFVLAVWFMDDGTLSNRFHPRITFGLDDLSRKRAFRALRKLGLKPVLHEEGSTISIDFPGQSEVFFDMVGPHLHECMEYKRPRESERREQDKNARKLTPETARELYDGNMSVSEISDLYGVGRSTVHRRIHNEGAPKRMGRPRRSYSLRAAEEVLANIDHKAWSNLPQEGQDTQVEHVVEVLRNLGFPTPEPWAEDRMATERGKLAALQTTCVDGAIGPQSWRGTQACASFFPHRYRSSYRGRDTAYEKWHDDKALTSAVRFQLSHGDPVLPHRVLRALTMQYRTPGVFRPVVAKHLYTTYCKPGGKVWDPCAGWGGRLMGAVTAGVEYLGTDVEFATVEGNREIAKALGAQASLVHSPAEEFDPPEVDFVFTSPPYFDVEHYGVSPSQSFRLYENFDAWVEGFLRPVIETALKAAPVLALNVAPIRKRKQVIDLPSKVVEVATEVGFLHTETLRMPLASLNRKNASEPVLVFRR